MKKYNFRRRTGESCLVESLESFSPVESCGQLLSGRGQAMHNGQHQQKQSPRKKRPPLARISTRTRPPPWNLVGLSSTVLWFSAWLLMARISTVDAQEEGRGNKKPLSFKYLILRKRYRLSCNSLTKHFTTIESQQSMLINPD